MLFLKHNRHGCHDRSIAAALLPSTRPHFQVSGKNMRKCICMLFIPQRAKRPFKRIVSRSDSGGGRGRGSAALMIQMNEK